MGDPTRLVAGRYATIRELGRGGMGVVWLAEDQVIGRRVALKELRTTSTVELERVLREARTAGRLNSPNVVTVHDVISEHGTTYLVMELVDAPTVSDLMARQGPLSEEQVSSIGLQVLSALETAHAAGIVHRDVKPSNIMVLPDGRVKLADFGIARAMDDPGLTVTGGVMGSPGYMAPELFEGSPPSPASDLWALGATLFHAVEGRSPFQRDTTAATMRAIMFDAPVLNRCRGPLGAVVMGLLTQSVGARSTAARVREQLAGGPKATGSGLDADTVIVEAPTSFVAQQPSSGTRPSWAESWDDAEKPKRDRRKVGMIAGAAVTVVALALAGVFLLKPNTKQGEASAQQGVDTSSSASSTPASASSTVSSAAPSSTSSSSSAPTSTTAAVTPTKPADNPAPAPTATTTRKPRQVLEITRYNDGTWHYSGTSNLAPPPGFTRIDGPLGGLAANAEEGTRPLYACKSNNSSDRMTSLDVKCEGHQYYGLLGHIFTTPPADAPVVPLYRCDSGGHHFDQLDVKCEGYTKEFQFGFVLA